MRSRVEQKTFIIKNANAAFVTGGKEWFDVRGQTTVNATNALVRDLVANEDGEHSRDRGRNLREVGALAALGLRLHAALDDAAEHVAVDLLRLGVLRPAGGVLRSGLDEDALTEHTLLAEDATGTCDAHIAVCAC